MEVFTRRHYNEIVLDPTVDTAAYAAGDLLCEKLELAVGYDILLSKIVVIDLAAQDAELTFIFFTSNPSGTTFTENAALDIADADLDKISDMVTIMASDYEDFADNSCACVYTDNIPVKVTGGTLYCAVEVGGTSTPDYVAAGDIRLKFGYFKA